VRLFIAGLLMVLLPVTRNFVLAENQTHDFAVRPNLFVGTTLLLMVLTAGAKADR
jgi:hypothetical protein